LVGSFQGANQVWQAFASFFLDIIVWMFFDNFAEKLDCFFDVRGVKFLQLFDENVEH
jgi:hypothetical protein